MRTSMIVTSLSLFSALAIGGCAAQGDPSEYGFDDTDSDVEVVDGKADSQYGGQIVGKFENAVSAFGHFKFLQLKKDKTFAGVFDLGSGKQAIVDGSYNVGDSVFASAPDGKVALDLAIVIKPAAGLKLNSMKKSYVVEAQVRGDGDIALNQILGFTADKGEYKLGNRQELVRCKECSIESYDPNLKYDDKSFLLIPQYLKVLPESLENGVHVPWDTAFGYSLPDPLFCFGLNAERCSSGCDDTVTCTADKLATTRQLIATGKELREGIRISAWDADVGNDTLMGEVIFSLSPDKIGRGGIQNLSNLPLGEQVYVEAVSFTIQAMPAAQ